MAVRASETQADVSITLSSLFLVLLMVVVARAVALDSHLLLLVLPRTMLTAATLTQLLVSI